MPQRLDSPPAVRILNHLLAAGVPQSRRALPAMPGNPPAISWTFAEGSSEGVDLTASSLSQLTKQLNRRKRKRKDGLPGGAVAVQGAEDLTGPDAAEDAEDAAAEEQPAAAAGSAAAGGGEGSEDSEDEDDVDWEAGLDGAGESENWEQTVLPAAPAPAKKQRRREQGPPGAGDDVVDLCDDGKYSLPSLVLRGASVTVCLWLQTMTTSSSPLPARRRLQRNLTSNLPLLVSFRPTLNYCLRCQWAARDPNPRPPLPRVQSPRSRHVQVHGSRKRRRIGIPPPLQLRSSGGPFAIRHVLVVSRSFPVRLVVDTGRAL